MYRIEITATAQADADDIYAWMVQNRSPAHAVRWYRELFESIGTLARHPARCPLAAESEKFPQEIRELLHGKRKSSKHRILFEIAESTVFVLYIRHASRDELMP